MTAPGDGSGSGEADAGGGSGEAGDELPAAVEDFLREAETVFGEYDQGYMDADAALTRLRRGVEDLRSAGDE